MIEPAFLGPFEPPFMQRAALEILLLSIPAGLLGTWVVLHRLAFFTHAAGTAALPGLVVAGPWGIPAQVGALAAALGFAGGAQAVSHRGRVPRDVATGVLLAAALAVGVVLASDVYESGAGLDRLLFGSVLAVDARDLALAGLVAAAVVAVDAALRRSWLVSGFDGAPRPWSDRALLAALAVAVVVALDAVGALLVSALFVVPAATARLLTRSVGGLRAAAIALAAVEGLVALWLARELDVGPGAALAVISGGVFAAVGAGQAVWRATA